MGAEIFMPMDGRTDRHDDADCRLRKRQETYYLMQVKKTRSVYDCTVEDVE